MTRVGKTFQRGLVCIILCCISHGRLNVWFKIVCAEACSSPVRTSLDYLQFSHRPKQRSDRQQSSTAATECNARVSNPWACEAARHSGAAAEHSTVTMPWEAYCWETAPVQPSESCWRKTWHAKENMLLTLLRPLKLQNISGNSGHLMNWSTIINHLRSAPTPGQLWPWKSPPWAPLLGASSAPPRTSSWQPPIALPHGSTPKKQQIQYETKVSRGVLWGKMGKGPVHSLFQVAIIPLFLVPTPTVHHGVVSSTEVQHGPESPAVTASPSLLPLLRHLSNSWARIAAEHRHRTLQLEFEGHFPWIK